MKTQRISRAYLAPAAALLMTLAAGPALADGFIVGGTVSGTLMPDRKSDLRSAAGATGTFEREHNTGYGVGLAYGYGVDLFRLQLEGDYYRTEIDKGTFSAPFTGTYDSQIDLYTATLNAYVDAPLDRWGVTGPLANLRPYVGAGIGAGWMQGDLYDGDGIVYQGSAGLAYNMGDGLSLDLGYRYTRMPVDDDTTVTGIRVEGADFEIHRVGLGLRYQFGASKQNGYASNQPVTMQPVMGEAGAPMGMPGPAALPSDMAPGTFGGTYGSQQAYGAPPAYAAQPAYGAPGTGALMGAGMPAYGAPALAGGIPDGMGEAVHGGSGRYGVQVGAFNNSDAAMAAWPAAQRRHGLSGAAPRVVAEQVPGKGRMHRLYAAGLSKSEADRACSRMKARGDWCRVAAL